MVIKHSGGYKEKVRHVGTFDFKETYRILFEWLIQRGYVVDETSYKEVIGAGGAKEVEVRWTAKKDQSDYFQYEFGIYFHPLAMTKIEVEIGGVKQKIDKGDFTIELNWLINKDYKNRFQSGFSRGLRQIYDNYLARNRIEEQEQLIVGDFEEMVALLKDFLALTGTR